MTEIDFSEGLLKQARVEENPDIFCLSQMQKRFHDRLVDKKSLYSSPRTWEILKLDIDINAAGIAYVAKNTVRA
jgi:hypothetical protein